MRRFRAAGVFAVLLSGCHTVPLHSQPFDHSTREAAPLRLFEVDWRVELVGPRIWDYRPLEPARPAVDPDTGRIVVLTRDGRVRSVSPQGRVEWEFKTEDPFVAGATVQEDVAYVPGGDGVLYALRARDGSVAWKYDAGEQLATPPLVADGRVYVASQGNTLFAVDAKNGQWLWQYRRDLPAGFMVQGVGAPTLANGILYAGFADGFLVALDPATGAVKWERALSSPGKEFLDVDTKPILDQAGRIIAASYKDGIYALDPATGEVVWTTVSAGVTGALERGGVVFTTGDHGVTAVLAENGSVLWGVQLGDRAAQPPAFAPGLLAVPVETALLFIDPASGHTRLRWDPGEGVTATPASAGRRLYVLSNTGYLYALRLRGRGG